MFNEDIEKGEEAEAWLSGMRKYFQIYNYFDGLKEKMTIYNLTGKKYIWWQDIKKVKGILNVSIFLDSITKKKIRNFMN